MTITTDQVLDWTLLGVKGVIPQDPDGIFSGRMLWGGDASGGTASGRFLLSALSLDVPKDVLMKLSYFHLANLDDANDGLDLSVSLNSLGPLMGPSGGPAGWTINKDDIAQTGAILEADTGFTWRPPSEGHYNWTQKGVNPVYLTAIVDNLNVTTWFNFVVQGHYWYMGPRRLEQIAADNRRLSLP